MTVQCSSMIYDQVDVMCVPQVMHHSTENDTYARNTFLPHTTPYIKDTVLIVRYFGTISYYTTLEEVTNREADVIMVLFEDVLYSSPSPSCHKPTTRCSSRIFCHHSCWTNNTSRKVSSNIRTSFSVFYS